MRKFTCFNFKSAPAGLGCSIDSFFEPITIIATNIAIMMRYSSLGKDLHLRSKPFPLKEVGKGQNYPPNPPFLQEMHVRPDAGRECVL